MLYPEFRKILSGHPIFSIQEIEKYFSGFDKRRLVEWQERGYITKIRNRYYYFSDQVLDEAFLFYTANVIYRPAYISLESALSWYNFIPEAVFQFTSCTTLKTNKFDTALGMFTYRNLKPNLYFGYVLVRWNNQHYVIADPEKTIIDYLYLNNEISNIDDINALRWNKTEIKNRISEEKLYRYEQYIKSRALSNRLKIFKYFLYADT